VETRAGLDDREKRKFLTVLGLELGLPARNQSLYRLRYPGTYKLCTIRYLQVNLMALICSMKTLYNGFSEILPKFKL
jgi:hypothetical protein